MRTYPEIDIIIQGIPFNQFTTAQARNYLERKKGYGRPPPTTKRLCQLLRMDPRIKQDNGGWAIAE